MGPLDQTGPPDQTRPLDQTGPPDWTRPPDWTGQLDAIDTHMLAYARMYAYAVFLVLQLSEALLFPTETTLEPVPQTENILPPPDRKHAIDTHMRAYARMYAYAVFFVLLLSEALLFRQRRR